MDFIKARVVELINENIQLLKENDVLSRTLRDKNMDVSKYRSFLKEVSSQGQSNARQDQKGRLLADWRKADEK